MSCRCQGYQSWKFCIGGLETIYCTSIHTLFQYLNNKKLAHTQRGHHVDWYRKIYNGKNHPTSQDTGKGKGEGALMTYYDIWYACKDRGSYQNEPLCKDNTLVFRYLTSVTQHIIFIWYQQHWHSTSLHVKRDFSHFSNVIHIRQYLLWSSTHSIFLSSSIKNSLRRDNSVHILCNYPT